MGRRKILLIILLLVPLAVPVAQPLRISVSQSNQSVDFEITLNDVIGGAGTDVAAWFYSAIDEKELDIRNPDDNWRVDVRRSDTTWHSELQIALLRTGDGTGSGTLTGGDVDYVIVTTTDTEFFTGTGGDARNVPVQFRLRGSIGTYSIPAGSYVTTIVYTVSDGL